VTRTRRHTIRWTAATLLHTTLIAAVGYSTYQALPAMGLVWRWVFVIGITLTASLAADRPLGRLYRSPKPARTGPEFARNHGNDSSTWTSADFDSLQSLAAMDAQIAYRVLHTPRPTTEAPATGAACPNRPTPTAA